MRSIPEGALGWVYKILNKEKEVERLLYDDPDPTHGFLINVDPKWTTHPDTTRAGWRDVVAAANFFETENASNAAPGTSATLTRANAAYANELYCLGLCHRRDVRSLRDLRGEHLPMLRAMLRKGREIAAETYGVPTESLRCFVHYPPQFYHFHAHFTHVAVDFGVSTRAPCWTTSSRTSSETASTTPSAG